MKHTQVNGDNKEQLEKLLSRHNICQQLDSQLVWKLEKRLSDNFLVKIVLLKYDHEIQTI